MIVNILAKRWESGCTITKIFKNNRNKKKKKGKGEKVEIGTKKQSRK